MNARSIKVIQTRYRGYWFRSRLEARWAVYLDTVGWEWEYEPEGFEFKDGTRYLPDFRIVNCGDGCKCFWLEIKAAMPTSVEKRKAEFVSNGTDTPFLIAAGMPQPAVDYIHCYSPGDLSSDWSVCDIGTYAIAKWGRPAYMMCCNDTITHEDILACYAAKSARFEFA